MLGTIDGQARLYLPPTPHLSWLPFSFSVGLRILIVKMRFFEFLPLFMPFWVNQYYTNLLIPNLPVYRPGVGIGSVLANPTSEWMLVRRHCPRLSCDSQVNTCLRSHSWLCFLQRVKSFYAITHSTNDWNVTTRKKRPRKLWCKSSAKRIRLLVTRGVDPDSWKTATR